MKKDEIDAAIERFRRGQHDDADLIALRAKGLVTPPSRRRVKFTTKALKLLGNRSGCWYCPTHGLNGCDGRPKKNADCTCPHRQDT